MQQLPLAMRLRERAVFDAFVSGDNAAVIEALRAAALGGSGVAWLFGPSGAGKSHLLQAACTLALAAGRDAAYLPLSELLALGPAALAGWPQAALVALDGIEPVIGQPDWERSLFALHRDVEERGAALIAAAQVPPRALTFALPDLGSRFTAAALLALRPLDETGQRLALQRRAHARGLELPDEGAVYLQRRFRRDLPTLCALLDTIDGAALQAQRRLTVPFIRQVLASTPPGAA